MREPIRGLQFRRDVKYAEKRGKNMAKLRKLLQLLIDGHPLPLEYRDHSMQGDWKHHRNSHIQPDWLLIYKIDGNDIYLVRTGTHADIFGL